MKMNKLLFVTTLSIIVVTGCASKQEQVRAPEPQPIAQTTTTVPQTEPVQQQETVSLVVEEPPTPEPVAIIAEVAPPPQPPEAIAIYFPFDSSEVNGSSNSTIEHHAEFLLNNPNNMVILEGHADERGSSKYNFDLGAQRVAAIRSLLIEKGVKPEQIRTVSFGEDKPATVGHDETAWQSNRRAIFSYSASSVAGN